MGNKVEKKSEKKDDTILKKALKRTPEEVLKEKEYIDVGERHWWHWWTENWRWMKFGVMGLAIVWLLGVNLGWWREDAGVSQIRVSAMTPGVEVPDLPMRVLDGSKKLVALTFDDGPNESTTQRLLDILKEKHVYATFFVLGIQAERYPDIVKREIREGHEVGSHTMRHKVLSTLPANAIKDDTNDMKRVMTGILGYNTKITRPPYGAINDTVRGSLGAPLIIWSVDTEDWKSKDAGAVRAEAERATFDGAIVLMHDIYPSTVDAVGGIIDSLRSQDYEFVTVSEMAKARKVKMQNGEVYGAFKR